MCAQFFPDQVALDQHTQSDHPTDASGFLYIPVERFRSKRLLNDSEPTENDVRPNFGLSTRIPNTGHEGSKREIVVRRDRTSGRSKSLCSADSCDTRDGRGRCRYSNHHASQTLLHSGQSFVVPSGNADTTHNRGTPAITSQSAFTQAPQSSSTRSNVEVAGDRRPSVLPGTPAQIQQLFCSKCFQWFTGKAAFDRHLLVCSIPCQPPTNRQMFTCTKCDLTFPSMVGLRSHSNNSHRNPTPAAPPITSRNTNPTPAPPSRCEPCKHDFPTPKALKLHLLNSSSHAPKHRCNFCTLQFGTQGALVVHGVLDHGLDFPCDQCDSWFATEELREIHVGSAHKKIEIQSVQHSLNLSASSNVGVRASIFKNAIHQCGNCQETFRKPKKLNRHLQLCSKPRPEPTA